MKYFKKIKRAKNIALIRENRIHDENIQLQLRKKLYEDKLLIELARVKNARAYITENQNFAAVKVFAYACHIMGITNNSTCRDLARDVWLGLKTDEEYAKILLDLRK